MVETGDSPRRTTSDDSIGMVWLALYGFWLSAILPSSSLMIRPVTIVPSVSSSRVAAY